MQNLSNGEASVDCLNKRVLEASVTQCGSHAKCKYACLSALKNLDGQDEWTGCRLWTTQLVFSSAWIECSIRPVTLAHLADFIEAEPRCSLLSGVQLVPVVRTESATSSKTITACCSRTVSAPSLTCLVAVAELIPPTNGKKVFKDSRKSSLQIVQRWWIYLATECGRRCSAIHGGVAWRSFAS